MTYRDDREALRQRAEAATEALAAAESELAAARAELEQQSTKDAIRWQRIASLQEEVNRLRDVAQIPPDFTSSRPPTPDRVRWYLAVGAVLLGALCSAVFAPATGGDPWFGLVADVTCPLVRSDLRGPFSHHVSSYTLLCRDEHGGLSPALELPLSVVVFVSSSLALWAFGVGVGTWLVGRLGNRSAGLEDPAHDREP